MSLMDIVSGEHIRKDMVHKKCEYLVLGALTHARFMTELAVQDAHGKYGPSNLGGYIAQVNTVVGPLKVVVLENLTEFLELA